MLQLQTIIQDVYDKLSVSSDSETYHKTRRVIPKINSVLQRVCEDRKFDVLLQDSTQHPFIKGGDLSFLQKSYFFDSLRSLPITTEALANSQRLYYDNKRAIPGDGFLYIEGFLSHYTLITETIDGVLVNVILLDIPLPLKMKRGTPVEFLYPCPALMEDSFQLLEVNREGVREIIFTDYRYPNDAVRHWTIYQDLWQPLIRITNWDYEQRYKLNYYRKIQELVNDTDISPLPDKRRDYEVVANIAAGELLYETEETDDATKKLNEGYGALVLFYDKYSTANKGFRRELGRKRGLQQPWYLRTRYR